MFDDTILDKEILTKESLELAHRLNSFDFQLIWLNELSELAKINAGKTRTLRFLRKVRNWLRKGQGLSKKLYLSPYEITRLAELEENLIVWYEMSFIPLQGALLGFENSLQNCPTTIAIQLIEVDEVKSLLVNIIVVLLKSGDFILIRKIESNTGELIDQILNSLLATLGEIQQKKSIIHSKYLKNKSPNYALDSNSTSFFKSCNKIFQLLDEVEKILLQTEKNHNFSFKMGQKFQLLVSDLRVQVENFCFTLIKNQKDDNNETDILAEAFFLLNVGYFYNTFNQILKKMQETVAKLDSSNDKENSLMQNILVNESEIFVIIGLLAVCTHLIKNKSL